MNITQITVSYGGTQSLPEYSNTKVNLILTATLDEGDDPAVAEAELWALAKAHAHEQIDLALEANDRAAKYDPAPRYQVVKTYWNQWDHRGEEKPPQYVVILPNEINIDRGAYSQRLVHTVYPEGRKLRYPHAQRIAEATVRENAEDAYTLLDCSNGDLTPLNLALSAPESNPEVAPTEDNPF